MSAYSPAVLDRDSGPRFEGPLPHAGKVSAVVDAAGVAARYAVVDGETLSEKRDASRYLYVPDPLGSINHLLDTGQTIAGTTTYYPYGEVQSHTGPDTPLQFVGGLGYYTGTANRVYVRARDYRPDLGRWVTRQYAYGNRTPAGVPGLYGLQAQPPPPCSGLTKGTLGQLMERGQGSLLDMIALEIGTELRPNDGEICQVTGTIRADGRVKLVVTHTYLIGGGPSPCTFEKDLTIGPRKVDKSKKCPESEECTAPKRLRVTKGVHRGGPGGPIPVFPITIVTWRFDGKATVDVTVKVCRKSSIACAESGDAGT